MHGPFATLAGICTIVASTMYIVGILRGNTKPPKGSWITWAVVDIALLIGMFSKDTSNAQIIASTVASTIVASLSLRWGRPGWLPVEKICLAILPFGLGLWWFTREANWNILISLGLITLGCLPTYQSMYANPEYENRASWTVAFIGSALMLFALPPMTEWFPRSWETLEMFIALVLQPLVWFGTIVPMMYLLWMRPRSKMKTASDH